MLHDAQRELTSSSWIRTSTGRWITRIARIARIAWCTWINGNTTMWWKWWCRWICWRRWYRIKGHHRNWWRHWWWRPKCITFKSNKVNWSFTMHRYKFDTMKWYAMRKSAEMWTIYCNFVLRRFGQDEDVKRLTKINWTVTITFFWSPAMILIMISNKCHFFWSYWKVQGNIVSRLSCWPTLNIYL